MAADYASLTIEWASDASPATWIQLFPANPVIGGIINLTEIDSVLDLGRAQLETFMEPRVLLNGQNYYGGVYSEAREITLPIEVRSSGAAAGMDWIRIIQGWFPTHVMGTLRFTRLSAGGDTVRSILRCTPPLELLPFRHAHDGSGHGIIGSLSSGRVILPVPLSCPKPLFRDYSPTESELVSVVSGTTGELQVINYCPHEIGARVIARGGSFTGLTARNLTNGRGFVFSQPIALPQVLAVDWFASDEDALRVTIDGAGNYIPYLSVSARLTLDPGANDLEFDLGVGDAEIYVQYWGSYGSL